MRAGASLVRREAVPRVPDLAAAVLPPDGLLQVQKMLIAKA